MPHAIAVLSDAINNVARPVQFHSRPALLQEEQRFEPGQGIAKRFRQIAFVFQFRNRSGQQQPAVFPVRERLDLIHARAHSSLRQQAGQHSQCLFEPRRKNRALLRGA